ncbi:hypothetical protein BSPWISOXPB_1550 [uncultured Gammaproteobacteria bacterium]|nr:hypothetical protein BSPWISOXPB_1550 [uncultured Gammaproteobacteria bacterium]
MVGKMGGFGLFGVVFKGRLTIIAITFMPLIFVAQAQEVKSQDNPVMQDRSWNLTKRSFEPPIQPVQQKKKHKK